MELYLEYDSAIEKSINSKYIVKDYYFGDDYHKRLGEELGSFKEALIKEYEKDYGNNRYKMCCVVSSSRLGFLYLRKHNGIKFEEILHNRGCNPNLDAYLPKYKTNNNVYFECKCHEIVKPHSTEMSSRVYKPLLKEYFGIKYKGDIKLDYKDFGISPTYDKRGKELKCGKYFDFKQLLCHIFGLLSLEEKPTLQYVFFIPVIGDNTNKRIKEWYEQFKVLVANIFDGIKELKTYKNTQETLLKDLINFADPEFVPVNLVKDFD